VPTLIKYCPLLKVNRLCHAADVDARELPLIHFDPYLNDLALAWSIRSGNVFAIPESGSVAHVKENAVALTLTLTPQELQTLDAAYPPPSR
jgi:diketogulonate reductase-like aldo/keto reductase